MISPDIDEMTEFGADAGRGNLLGIQPFMVLTDYASQEAFYARLDHYMQLAGQKGWLGERTVVVWPEYLGTWLVAVDEPAEILRTPTITAAMRSLVLRHPLAFAARFLSAGEKDKATASIFRLKAGAMSHVYQSVFSGLAAHYRVTLVAGSIVLPSPRVANGQVAAGAGPLYNVSAVYRPDGSAYPVLARKAYPISDEFNFVSSAPQGEAPVYDTPAGRLGVLVCADAWYPAPYEPLKAAGVELIAVPIFGIGTYWDAVWQGYNGAAAPADVDLNDIGRITEGQANRKYALAGRLEQSGAGGGINVCARGRLWDLDGNDCPGSAVRGDQVYEGGRGCGGMINLWL
jgi:predicted amidohydrolase